MIYIAEGQVGISAGFIHLQIQTDYFNREKVANISEKALNASCDGQGIGRILLGKAAEFSREQWCSLLTLHVFSKNSRARKFYEKLDFHEEITKYVKPLIQKEY